MFIKLIKIRRVKYPKKILKSLAVFLLVTSWLLSGWPGIWMDSTLLFPPRIKDVQAITCGFGTDINGSECRGYITVTGSGTWTVPSDWSNTNKIETIGGGGGAGTSAVDGTGGGGGGAYSYVQNLSGLAGSISYSVGVGGSPGFSGGNTWFNGVDCTGSSVCAGGGGSTPDETAGLGGSVQVGTGYSGGNGGVGGTNADDGGGGGGGAAGPGGIGKNGGGLNGNNGGGGGGGAGGVSSTAGSNPSGNTGGAGGNGPSGSGGGIVPGGAGSIGGGGAGGTQLTTETGGTGGNGTEWNTYGAGGGGGGGADAGPGANGGLYGGGGGGTGEDGAVNGSGGQGIIVITYTPLITTTLSTSTDPSPATVAPASGIRSAGQFTFTTSAGSDTITALTLTLAGSPAGSYAAIDSVSIRDTSCSGTLYFSAVTPSSDSVSFSGGTALSVSTSPGNTYYICVTPKDHTLASGTYSVSPYVSGTWTSGNGNTKAGTDDNANALTIDNTAPNGATSVSGTAGNAAITINWTTSDSSDFNTTSGSVVYRWASGSAGSEVPAEGSTPSVGSTNGTATAACVISSAASSAQSKIDGTGGSAGCTTTALTNGQAYTYKVFQKDNYGNYDAGVSIGTFTPTAASATFTQNKYLWYVDNDLADPTDIWGNPDLIENQAIVVVPPGNDPPGTSQELRLRVNYVVNTTGISISEKYFKLEYKAGTDGTCTTGSWTDVGTGDWVYATSGVTDGADIVKVLSDTTTGKGQEYVKSKPSQANHVAASAAEIIEYDFHIVGTSATANTQYSFRVVETNNLGTTEVVFDGYTSCPTLTTEPGTANLMRHGNVFTEGIEKGFFWVN